VLVTFFFSPVGTSTKRLLGDSLLSNILGARLRVYGPAMDLIIFALARWDQILAGQPLSLLLPLSLEYGLNVCHLGWLLDLKCTSLLLEGDGTFDPGERTRGLLEGGCFVGVWYIRLLN
jgi:hypothetical protein